MSFHRSYAAPPSVSPVGYHLEELLQRKAGQWPYRLRTALGVFEFVAGEQIRPNSRCYVFYYAKRPWPEGYYVMYPRFKDGKPYGMSMPRACTRLKGGV